MGKKNYLGGNTIISKTGTGWSQDDLETIAPVGLQKKPKPKRPDKFDIALEQFAKDCARKDNNGEKWPDPPQILKTHFGKKRSYLRNTIKSHKSYLAENDRLKNEE